MTVEAKELTSAISNMDEKKLIELAVQHKSKKTPYNFRDVLNKLTDQEVKEMWEQLKVMIVKHSDAMCKEEENTEVCVEASQILQAALDLAQVTLDENLTLSQGMLHMIIYMNSILFDIPAILENLRNNIILLCERVCHLKYVTKDQLFICNTLMYLLKRTLTPKATKKDLKRLYALRSLLPEVLELEDSDQNEMWELFKKCASSGLYNSMNEGQKILSMTLSMDMYETITIHEAIMKKMSSCSKKQAVLYGKAYLEAWIHSVKTENERLKDKLEFCIEDIIVRAIKERPKSVVDSLRKVLSQFHCQKKEVYVAKMLYSIYQPILWRFLKHPDGVTRAHAAQLFLDVFPLEDPDNKVVTTDLELQDQFLMIQDLLLDDFPIVRTTTVARLCVAMSANWEIFPEDTLKNYFKIIANDLSYDSSSSEVRTAVAKGMKALLENPLTVCTMRAILPKLKHLFHDISDTVRVAFCSLLLKVKQMSDIKYFDIVPLDDLLARLEEDAVTAKMIVNLICNSFFPKEKTSEWLLRCSRIIRKSQAAARVLFQYMPHFTPHLHVAKFISQSVYTIHYFVKSSATHKEGKPGRSSRSSAKEQADDHLSLGKACGFDDPVILRGYIDGFVIMWLATINSLKKPENKQELKRLVGKLSKYLSELALHFKDCEEVFPSIAYLGSYLASVHVPMLASLCFVRLGGMTEQSEHHSWKTMLRCLCNQRQEDALLDLLREWIEPELTPLQQQPPPSKKRRTTKAEKEHLIKNQSRQRLGVKMLDFLLCDKPCQKTLLESQDHRLKGFLQLWDPLQQRIVELEQKTIPEEEVEFVRGLFHVLLKISVHLDTKDSDCESVKCVEEGVAWTESTLCKLAWPTKAESSRRKLCLPSPTFEHLASAICKDVCTVAGDLAQLGMMDAKLNKYIKFAMNLLKTGQGAAMLLPVSKLLWKHMMFGVYLCKVKQRDDLLTFMPDCFSQIVTHLRDTHFLEAIPNTDVREIQSYLSLSLFTMHQHGVLREVLSDIVLCLLKSILSRTTKRVSDDWESIQRECEPFSKITLPKCSSFLLSMVSNKQKILIYFLHLLNKHVLKSEKDVKCWVACYVMLHQLHQMKNISKNLNKEMNVIKNTLSRILSELLPLQFGMNKETESSHKLSFNVHCHSEIKRLKAMLPSKSKSPEKVIKLS